MAGLLISGGACRANEEFPGLYPGAWFDAARERIAALRMADFAVEVIDETGNRVEGADVSVAMTRHRFPFGSAVVAQRLVEDDSADGERYRAMVTSLFTRVVFENDFKWPAWEGSWKPGHRRQRTLEAVDWLGDHDIELRGHCLVWPGWKNLPSWLRDLEGDPDRLRAEIERHIRDIMGAVKGRVTDWDVVNETYWNHDLQDRLGREAMLDWFRWAEQADPNAGRYINDARIVSFGGIEQEHKEHYYDEVAWLLDRGAPLTGIGFQCHFREASLTHPEDALAMLDRFAAFGLDLAITELDVEAEDEDVQARYLHDILYVAFSHPSVVQILTWGFWEGQIFERPRALFREDWTPKPAGEVFLSLIRDVWWTREQGVTAVDGAFRGRGFHGDYAVTVSAGDRRAVVHRTLDPGEAPWQIVLSNP